MCRIIVIIMNLVESCRPPSGANLCVVVWKMFSPLCVCVSVCVVSLSLSPAYRMIHQLFVCRLGRGWKIKLRPMIHFEQKNFLSARERDGRCRRMRRKMDPRSESSSAAHTQHAMGRIALGNKSPSESFMSSGKRNFSLPPPPQLLAALM